MSYVASSNLEIEETKKGCGSSIIHCQSAIWKKKWTIDLRGGRCPYYIHQWPMKRASRSLSMSRTWALQGAIRVRKHSIPHLNPELDGASPATMAFPVRRMKLCLLVRMEFCVLLRGEPSQKMRKFSFLIREMLESTTSSFVPRALSLL